MSQPPRTNLYLISIVMIIASGFMWSFSGILIKLIDWNPVAIAGVRSFFGGLIELAFLVTLCASTASTGNCERGLSGPDKRVPMIAILHSVLRDLYDLLASKNIWVWTGGAAFLINVIALTAAFQISTALNAVFLHYSGTVLVGFLSGSILHERPARHDWLALTLGLPGIGLIVYGGMDFHAYLGTVLGVIAGLTLAWSQICLRKLAMQDKLAGLKVTILVDAAVTLLALPFIVWSFATGTAPSWNTWWYLLLIAIIPWGIPNVLYTVAIANVPAFRALLLALLDPVFTAVWPIVFLGEHVSGIAVVGCILVSTAVVMQGYLSAKERSGEAATAIIT